MGVVRALAAYVLAIFQWMVQMKVECPVCQRQVAAKDWTSCHAIIVYHAKSVLGFSESNPDYCVGTARLVKKKEL